jgi:hypothetical protein
MHKEGAALPTQSLRHLIMKLQFLCCLRDTLSSRRAIPS